MSAAVTCWRAVRGLVSRSHDRVRACLLLIGVVAWWLPTPRRAA